MLEIRIHHKTKEEQAAMRDLICNTFAGWKPFIEGEVAVVDYDEKKDPEPITYVAIGPDMYVGDQVVAMDMKASDIHMFIGWYPRYRITSQGYKPEKLYD